MAKIVDINGSRYHKECDVLAELRERKTKYSPNWLIEKHQEWHPLFVYGTLRSGGRHHKLLSGSKFLGAAWTSTIGWTLYESMAKEPLAKRCNTNNMNAYRIFGEVYMISPKTLLSIDVFFKNGEVHDRVKTFAFLGDQCYETKSGPKRPSIKCNIYEYNTEFWKGVYLGHGQFLRNAEGTRFHEYIPPFDNEIDWPSLFNQGTEDVPCH